MIGESGLIGVALGMGLGARHALEPNHLAAVSVLAADRPCARRGLLIGALWGIGHILSLLACGLAVAIAAAQIPAQLTALFEVAVAAILAALDARAVIQAVREQTRRRARPHTHRGYHPDPPVVSTQHLHVARHGLAIRPLLAGWPLARLVRGRRRADTCSPLPGRVRSCSAFVGLDSGAAAAAIALEVTALTQSDGSIPRTH